MTINATLIAQMITFALFVWFTMRFVWPHIMTALEEREGKIADGLAAAERGHRELALAQQKAVEALRQVREQATGIIDNANRRASRLVEEAKGKATQERQRILDDATAEIARQRQQAEEQLRRQVSVIAVAGAEKILSREIDQAVNSQFVEQLVDEL